LLGVTLTSITRFVFWACVVIVLATLAAAQDYTWMEVPNPVSGSTRLVSAFNNAGQATGFAVFPSQQGHAFLWTPTGDVHDLGALPGDDSSEGFAINDNGDVVGRSYHSSVFSAFLWTSSGGMQNLGAFPGDSLAEARGINNAGQVVGKSCGSQCRAFLYTPGQGMQDLGNLGGLNSTALGINNSGQVVGWSYTAGNVQQHPFLWTQQGGMQDLGMLPGADIGSAIAINDSGEVVGQSGSNAFLWTQETGMQDLGAFQASGINDKGQVSGTLQLPKKRTHAALWTSALGLEDLNTLQNGHPHLFSAVGINSAGQIAIPYSYHQPLILSPRMNVAVISSSNPSSVRQAITFTATVNSAVQGPPPDGETVTFLNGKAVIGAGVISNGVATLMTSSLKAGTHTIKTVYSGDTHYASETSAVLKQVVSK
jgi:probable HAF family extracellular repeat protein